jgi:cysteate synthase
MYGVTNDAVFTAMELFEKNEGIDIVPAAGAAVAALKEAVAERTVKQNDVVLLNITGGGEKRLGMDRKKHDVEPRVISKKITEKEIEELLCDALKKN